ASTPAKAPETSQSAAGKITAKVEERATPVNESKDQLKLSKATGAPTDGKSGATASEDKTARDKQVADANARVKELEKNVADLEKLRAVKSKARADKQKAAAEPSASASASASAAASAPSASAVADASAPPKPKKIIKTAPPPIPQPGLMDTLMDNIQPI